jgi:hypothetical protein
MSVRRQPDPDELERFLVYEWNRLDASEQLFELRERFGERRLTARHCSTCGKDITAQADCAACGDETDVERDGDRGRPVSRAMPDLGQGADRAEAVSLSASDEGMAA